MMTYDFIYNGLVSVSAIAHYVLVKPSNTKLGLYILPAGDEAVTICPVTGIIEVVP